MKEKRAYSQAQFRALGIDTGDYKFNEQAGIYNATLDFKVWGKNKNILAFFTLEDGRKFISCAPHFKGYLGLADIQAGTDLDIMYTPNTKGKVYLTDVRRRFADEPTHTENH